MNTPSKTPRMTSVVEQVTTNTTSWIGHRNADNNDIIGGQTFIAPAEADLEAIEVFTSVVTTPGQVQLTVHNFDTRLNSWGPVLGSCDAEFSRLDNGKWKSFLIPGLHLNKGKTYGFRLESHNTFIGMGEAAGSSKTPPFLNGQEWKFINNDQQGHSYSYFSLAFKVDVRA